MARAIQCFFMYIFVSHIVFNIRFTRRAKGISFTVGVCVFFSTPFNESDFGGLDHDHHYQLEYFREAFERYCS